MSKENSELVMLRLKYDIAKLKQFILIKAFDKIKEIATKYGQQEDYLLSILFSDLVDELNEVLKDE